MSKNVEIKKIKITGLDYNKHIKMDKIDFSSWCDTVNKYMVRIINEGLTKKTDYENLRKQHQQQIHPYYAAIKEIVNTPQYLHGEFYESFVIPYQEKLMLVIVN
jgi:hypothetical protein